MTLAAAASRADPVKLLPGPFELPDRIGPMRFDGQPHRYDDPRLGASYQYLGGGLSLTVYVYDLGAENIPDGGDTRLACEAFEGAKGDVLHAGYQDLTVKSQQLARLDPAAEVPTAREAVFEYTRADRPTVSYLWITGAAKEFVKLRFSVDAQYRDELVEARRTVLTTLGDALKPHLAPAAPESHGRKAVVSVNTDTDPAEAGAAILYTIALGADADEHPEIVPLCGGDYVPDYPRELAAFQALVAMSKQLGKETKLSKRLDEISTAGFLDEFVWRYRHQDTWGDEPPEGLELPAFDRWRKKKLKRFQFPALGHISYDSPRPLPLEPAP
jgi:hypothetical protein